MEWCGSCSITNPAGHLNPHSRPFLCLAFNPQFPLLCVIQCYLQLKGEATDGNQHPSVMWGEDGENVWWVIKLINNGSGEVYCNPAALCFTPSLSELKNSLYRSFIAGAGAKLFSNSISFDSLCMAAQREEGLVCRHSIPSLPLPYFVVPPSEQL